MRDWSRARRRLIWCEEHVLGLTLLHFTYHSSLDRGHEALTQAAQPKDSCATSRAYVRARGATRASTRIMFSCPAPSSLTSACHWAQASTPPPGAVSRHLIGPTSVRQEVAVREAGRAF